jgi:hypothetical protein
MIHKQHNLSGALKKQKEQIEILKNEKPRTFRGFGQPIILSFTFGGIYYSTFGIRHRIYEFLLTPSSSYCSQQTSGRTTFGILSRQDIDHGWKTSKIPQKWGQVLKYNFYFVMFLVWQDH